MSEYPPTIASLLLENRTMASLTAYELVAMLNAHSVVSNAYGLAVEEANRRLRASQPEKTT